MQSHPVVLIRTSAPEFGGDAGQPLTAGMINCLSQTRVNDSALNDTQASPVLTLALFQVFTALSV